MCVADVSEEQYVKMLEEEEMRWTQQTMPWATGAQDTDS